MVFASILARHASPGTRVIVTTSDERRFDPLVEMHLGGLAAGSVERADLSTWSAIAGCARSHSPDLVVFPDGDRYLLPYLAHGLGPTRTRFLLLRDPRSARPLWRRTAKNYLVRLVSSIRPAEVALLVPGFGVHDVRLPSIPDPIDVEIDPTAPLPVALDPSKTWFGIFGAVSERKNAELVARSMIGSPRLRRNAGLVVAGRLAPAVRAVLSSLRRDSGLEIAVLDRLLTSRELNHLIKEVSCVVVAHDNDGPSGIFGKAAALGTPVVAAGAQSLRADTLSWPHGSSWCQLDEVSIAARLEAELGRGERPAPCQVGGPTLFAQRVLAEAAWAVEANHERSHP